MLMVTHAAVTGAAGLVIVNPCLAFPAGILIHLLMDKIPHTWSMKKYTQTVFKFSDVALTVIFISLLFLIDTPNRAGLIWGALGGVVVDVALVGIMAEKGKLAVWHTKRQPHKEDLRWLASDVAVFLLGLALIWILK
jgi:hypothetical protein